MKQAADPVAETSVGNEDMITWAYRLFLDREPENADAVKAFASLDRTQDVRRVFQGCDEYKGRNALHVLDVGSKVRPTIESRASAANAKLICDFIAIVWQELGEEMPHWSVLSSDQFKPDTIGEFEKEFFESGAVDADVLLSTLLRTGIDPGEIEHVVEFGCGLGRVTPFLARQFAHVSAIDISKSHLVYAKNRLDASKHENVALIQAEFPDFGLPDAYDLWVSRIVLQHNPPPIIRMILVRALTGLRSGGVAVFQVPTYAAGYSFTVREYVSAMHQKSRGIEMHCLPMEQVFEIVADNACVPLEVLADDSVSDPGWISMQFVVRKR